MRIFFTRILLPVCLLTLMSACRRTTPPADDGTPTLTVTIEPLRYFAEAIAGGHFEVNCMVPEGNSPETYDPTPRQLVELTKSRAYLRIGHIGFEQVWMERLEANAPEMQVFDTSRGISLIRDEGHAHGDHRPQPEGQGRFLHGRQCGLARKGSQRRAVRGCHGRFGESR